MVIKPVGRLPIQADCTATSRFPDLGSSSIAAAAAECSTELAVLMREIQNGLGEVGRLDDAPHLDSTLVLDQLAHQVQELGGEL